MPAEHFKPVVGYEGLYEVGNDGTVRNAKGKNLKPYGDRYLRVRLYKDGNHRDIVIHRLVASAFIPNPLNKPQINHIDGNRYNNSAENLEWCTASENVKHSFAVGLNSPEGARRANSKRVEQLDMSGNLVHVWGSLSDAARGLGLHIPNITHCCKGRIGSTGGYKWRYSEA